MEGPRGTKPEEFGKVMDLINSIWKGYLHEEAYPLMFNDENLGNLRIIVEDGKPVSHIGICEWDITLYGCTIEVGSIGSVCTYPEYRNRGYATRLLEDCIQKLDKDKADVMFVSGGRGLYRRAGCAPVGKLYHFDIGSQDLGKFENQEIQVLPYREEYLPHIVEAYQSEPVRFHRRLEDFRAALQVNGRETVVLCHEGVPLGYLVLHIYEREVEGSKMKVADVTEYAGARSAIVDAVKSLFEKYSIQNLNLRVLFSDKDLIYRLTQGGLTYALRSLPGTIRVINFSRLMGKLRPYLEERLGSGTVAKLSFNEDKSKFVFRLEDLAFGSAKDESRNSGSPLGSDPRVCGGYEDTDLGETKRREANTREEFAVKDIKELVALIFGMPDGQERELMPEKGGLVELLSAIFPLPFAWPGLNAV